MNGRVWCNWSDRSASYLDEIKPGNRYIVEDIVVFGDQQEPREKLLRDSRWKEKRRTTGFQADISSPVNYAIPNIDYLPGAGASPRRAHDDWSDDN